MFRLKMLLCASSAFAAVATSALAQTTPTNAPGSAAQAPPAGSSGAAPSDQKSAALSEIVVTAQQRGENLQKAAVAVDVVQGADLVKAGVNGVDALDKLVPALVIENGAEGNLIFIRGVGNFTLQPASDPASAFNYDGVYVGRSISTDGSFFDLQRIEVLKGPQGTLYGRNATAGAINVLPVQPLLDSYSGYGTVSYGDYNAVTAEGAVNAPLGDKAALRISGGYVRHDGYQADGESSEDTGGVRIQLKAEPTTDLTIRGSFDYAHEGGTNLGGNYIGKFALNPATGQYVVTPSDIDPSQGVYTAASQAFRQTVAAGTSGRNLAPLTNFPFEDNDFYGAHVQIDWKSPIGTFTLLPAYRRTDKDNLVTSAGFIIGDSQPSEQYSVEARLVSNPGGPIDYIFGAYYFSERISDLQSASTQGAASFTNSDYQTHSPAGYGRLTWHVTDRLRLTGGVRYTSDDKTFSSSSVTLVHACLLPTGCPTSSILPYTQTLAQQPVVPPASGDLVLIGPGDVTARVDSASTGKLSESKPTWRAAVEYDLAQRSLLYASVETGYRSGGFNTAVGFNTFAPETITAYTIGSKNRFLDNRLQLNLEVFDWEYRNQQISLLGVDLTGRSTEITKNAGDASIRGAELEARALLTPQTTISADLQYLDGTYNSFKYQAAASAGMPFTGCATARDATNTALYDVDCSGKPVFNSPKWTLNAGIQHILPVNEFNIVLSANTQLRTSHYSAADYIPQELVGTTTNTDAQVALSPKVGPWTVAVFVRNIEGHRTLIYATPSVQANLLVGEYSPPRTYGVRVSTQF